MATLDLVASAVADPTRRNILAMVRENERSVTDIAANFPMPRPAVSQHLRQLLDAELVTVRSHGTKNLYSARPEGLAGLRGWLDDFWNPALDRLAAAAEAEHRGREAQ